MGLAEPRSELVRQYNDVNPCSKTQGRDFDAATKQSIRNAAAAIMNSEKTRAIVLTNSFQDRAVAFGLDPDRVLSGVDATLFTPIAIQRSAQNAAEQLADAAEVAFNAAPESFEDVPQSGLARAGASVISAFQIWAIETGVLIRGSELKVSPDGQLFEKTKDGRMILITEDEIARASRDRAARNAELAAINSETGAGRLLRQTPTQQITRQ
ncbi:MAG: hypothetical protein IIC51_08110 [Planctomycetes bacterium]|nr:hypothetical protein [Planctomycetota bacterium]